MLTTLKMAFSGGYKPPLWLLLWWPPSATGFLQAFHLQETDVAEIYKLSPLQLGSAPLSRSKSTSSGRSLIAAQCRGVTPASSALRPPPASSFSSCFTLCTMISPLFLLCKIPPFQSAALYGRHQVQCVVVNNWGRLAPTTWLTLNDLG